MRNLAAFLLSTSALVTGAMAQSIDKVEWIASKHPETLAEKAEMFSTARVRTTFTDGSVTEQPLTYEMVMTNRTRVGANASPTATLYDEAMRPIADPTDPSQPLVSEEPDGSMLTNIGGKLYLVNQFEYDWLLANGEEVRKHPAWAFKHANGKDGSWGNNLPTTMLLTEVTQDPDTGKLTPIAQRPIDFSAVGGLVWACNANTTPWGTFISSEENYGVDARQVEAAAIIVHGHLQRAIVRAGESDGDAPRGGLVGLEPLLGRLDAVIDCVTQQVLKRTRQLLRNSLVEFSLHPRQSQNRLFPGLRSADADGPVQPVGERGQRDQTHAHQLVLRFAAQAALPACPGVQLGSHKVQLPAEGGKVVCRL
jgi:hypothetical protein